MKSSRLVPIPPGKMMKACDIRTKWCSREKKVRCAVTVSRYGFAFSYGIEMVSPKERVLRVPREDAAPSLAASIRPGPPPVTMSQPSSVSRDARSRTSRYSRSPGRMRALPKTATR